MIFSSWLWFHRQEADCVVWTLWGWSFHPCWILLCPCKQKMTFSPEVMPIERALHKGSCILFYSCYFLSQELIISLDGRALSKKQIVGRDRRDRATLILEWGIVFPALGNHNIWVPFSVSEPGFLRKLNAM